MSLYDRVVYLAKKQGKSLNKLSEDVGLSKNAIYSWKTSSPKSDTLEKVADYFDVSVDYLLGREKKDHPEETDLNNILDNMMSFSGKPMTDHDKEVIRAYLEGKFGKE